MALLGTIFWEPFIITAVKAVFQVLGCGVFFMPYVVEHTWDPESGLGRGVVYALRGNQLILSPQKTICKYIWRKQNEIEGIN